MITFSVEHQAWHWEANRTIGMRPTVYVQSDSPDGHDWQFAVREHDLGMRDLGPRAAIRVEVFDDAFAAFREIPEFFAGLDEVPAMSLDDVVLILRRMGAQDVTPYEVPAHLRQPGERRYA